MRPAGPCCKTAVTTHPQHQFRTRYQYLFTEHRRVGYGGAEAVLGVSQLTSVRVVYALGDGGLDWIGQRGWSALTAGVLIATAEQRARAAVHANHQQIKEIMATLRQEMNRNCSPKRV